MPPVGLNFREIAADDGVARASGVGEPPTGSDFSDENCRGEEYRRHGSKERPFRALVFSEVPKGTPSVGARGTER